jgi:hypothetical protein
MLNNNKLEEIGNLSYLSLANLLLLDLSNNQLRKVSSRLTPTPACHVGH